MLSFNIGLHLPWSWSTKEPGSRFDFCKSGKTPFRNKFWEVQTYSGSWVNVFDLSIDARYKYIDHGGFRIELTVFGYFMSAQIYDCRHWNTKENRWFEAGEQEDEYSIANITPYDETMVGYAREYVASRSQSETSHNPSGDPAVIIEYLLGMLEDAQDDKETTSDEE